MWSNGNLHDRVMNLQSELDATQTSLYSNPHSIEIKEDESHLLKSFNDVLLDKERFLKQKSKIEWLCVGDCNSSYFHKVVKGKTNRNRIHLVEGLHGGIVEGRHVASINPKKANFFIRSVTNLEVKEAMFSIGENKSPSPDGYTSAFFKCSWDIIDSIHDIVSENQSAFIPGRRISDNILLTHEIMKNYHLSRGLPRCAFKVDIKKAYDTVDWNFLRKRGLCQGDPISPYLFTLVMEVLTLMLKRNIRREEAFQFHPKCERQEIINVCFADDLFMFSYANVDSVKVISDALQEFKNCSGLVPSLPKSTTFFANVGIEVKNKILEMMHFEAGYMKRGKAKVKWDVVCLPKSKGGLGGFTSNSKDKLWWKDMEGNLLKFSVAQAWQAIRPRAPEVEWFDVVWFLQCISRHAFLVWLLIGEKLKTQDKIRAWEVAYSVSLEDMKCPLCNLIRDSHSHLFFECGISLQVWQRVKVLFYIPDIGNSWRSVVNTIQSSAHKKLARVVVAKVLFGATIYYIWHERNNRLFKKKARHADQIFELMFSTTRLKLMALNMKNSADVVHIRREWNITMTT
ncbi:polypyrimidine tract-binding protein homolog 2 isoform X1 [Tanacetum coccineum]